MLLIWRNLIDIAANDHIRHANTLVKQVYEGIICVAYLDTKGNTNEFQIYLLVHVI